MSELLLPRWEETFKLVAEDNKQYKILNDLICFHYVSKLSWF